jgi:hypothetical protein
MPRAQTEPTRPDDAAAERIARPDAAIALAAEGFHIGQCYGVTRAGDCLCGRAACKAPGKHGGLGWKEQATRDLDTIRTRFAAGDPNYLVIPPKGSGLLIVDEDVPGMLDTLGDLPTTMIVQTSEKPGGGRGRHVYGRLPEGIDEADLPYQWEGGEVRFGGNGGVVGPLSRHHSGATYEPLNGFAVETLPDPWVRMLIASGRKRMSKQDAARSPSDPDWIITEPGRHPWLTSVAGRLRRDGLHGDVLRQGLRSVNEARCSPPLPEAEVDEIAAWADTKDGDHGPSLAAEGRQREATTLLARCGVRRLDALPTGPPPPLLIDRLDPNGHTVIYGPGGVGKGVVAAWWIVRLVEAGHVVLIVDYEAHEAEWGRRIGSLGGPDAMVGVHYVAPLAPEWTRPRGPLWVISPDIRAIAEVIGATYIVIDSIVPACAGLDPLKPEAASQYASALQYLARPALSLAHVTKTDDARYPFGSVFWHNLARTTWSLASAGKGGSHTVVLTHRKHNNYSNLGEFLLTITWRDGMPVEVQEYRYSPVLAEQIGLVLGNGGLTVPEIITALSDDRDEGAETVKADSVRKALRRGYKESPQRFTSTGTGPATRWMNA